jgi:hypothetical protein
MPGITTQSFHPPMNLGPETPMSMNGSMCSILPLATITDSTRQVLLAALAQCAPFGSRKYSIPATSSPLSPHFSGRANSVSDATRNLPSKQSLSFLVFFLGKWRFHKFQNKFHPNLIAMLGIIFWT